MARLGSAAWSRSRASGLRLRDEFCTRIGDGLDDGAAAEALMAQLELIEAEMASILARHGPTFWMHVTRRLPPIRINGCTEWSMHLYRRILTLAVVKHADWDRSSDVRHENEVILADLTEDDVIDAFSLEYLAYEYHMTVTDHRKVGKGAVMRVRGGIPDAQVDDDTKALIQLLDERTARFAGLVSSSGTLVETDLPELVNGEVHMFAMAMTLAGEGLDEAEIEERFGVKLLHPPNYLPTGFSLEGLRAAAAPFDEEIREWAGVGVDGLLGAIGGMSAMAAAALVDSTDAAYQLLRTGYWPVLGPQRFDELVTEISRYLDDFILKFGGERLTEDAAVALTRAALDAITWHDSDRHNISLTDRLPFRALYPMDGAMLLDFEALAVVIDDLFRQVGSLDGEAGNLKGLDFEKEILRRAREAEIEVWESQKVLRAPDGSEREIDVGLKVGGTLYVTEAKAMSRNERLDRGDFTPLRGRWELLTKYLEQAESLRDFLAAHPTGANYALPDDVERLECFVVGPAVEYIPTYEQRFWFADEVPRICTPDELFSILKGEVSPSAVN